MKTSYHTQRRNMMECQIKPFSVIDERILTAFDTVAREEFVPETCRERAYLDEDLPVGQGRFMLEPPAFARLLQEAAITDQDRVLDIGCLTGYSTAILARLAGHVTGVDDNQWIALAPARDAIDHVRFLAGPLVGGDIQHAPYDVIVINGAVQTIPDALVAQLNDGGRIACFWRDGGVGTGSMTKGHAVLYTKHDDRLTKQILFDAFVPVLLGFEAQERFVL